MADALELNEHLRKMTVLKIADSPRSQELQQKRAYWLGSQHDHLQRNWSGAPWTPGSSYIRARQASQGFVPVNGANIASWLRRPDCQVPIGKQIVQRFTEMVIPVSDGQVPNVRVTGDTDTQEFVKAVFKKARAWEALMYARDMAGSQGCAAILCGLLEGTPYIEVLDPANLWVAQWDNSVPWFRPEVVVEQMKVTREVRDPETGLLGSEEYWTTRAWTTTESVTFKDVPCKDYKEGEELEIDDRLPHKLGRCPVVWYSNVVDLKCPDGDPDYDGVYENMDQIDRLESQVHKGTSANVDPTLVIREDRRNRNRVIEKGKVLGVPANGDAKFLEITGQSIETAQKQLDRELETVLQTVQCVIVSSTNATKMQSSESLQMLWRSMEAKANRLRTPFLVVVEEVADIFCRFGEKFTVGMDLLGTRNDKQGSKEQITLPPITDEDGNLKAHKLGSGGRFGVEFAPFFRPTPQQIASVAAAMSTATGAKQFLSTETATKTMCGFISQDGTDEVARLEQEREEEAAELEAEMEAEMDRELVLQESSVKLQAKLAPKPEPGGMPSGSAKNPVPQDPVTKPAAKAKKGKRGPAKSS